MTLPTPPYQLDMPDAEVWYYPRFFSTEASKAYYLELLQHIPWKADKVRMFGKWIDQPRLTALHAINSNPYTYSGLTLYPEPFTPALQQIHSKLQEELKESFSSCLLNLYRNGNDSNGWHADDEKELGKNPSIASISFGQDRIFHFRHKTDRHLKKRIVLEDGSLLLMKGTTQHHWQHQLPKSKKPMQPRINLTFRNIL
ncbi:alpha-ketoglutarate-dependent dioxygenase AlkB [Robertkochia marina]|uniref:Alpha-ketoglutarate-dependent dioxygenase AlkB n=1 Tax=Robertkochia marina TaxID=1227945 RepID=A0A4S3LXM3_9FLAO|nr:alpha-ketoglutarate-dependent dioxygenase AlkB [Robertkochia marina]THD65661.1 alpha-ketoglutarate-dependent dioxygenase AlkB [Robertkochia marina]TRZ46658.1 alpha-ketoglutarate-dependent dioxygenase AlkB [Robertkochia marina]